MKWNLKRLRRYLAELNAETDRLIDGAISAGTREAEQIADDLTDARERIQAALKVTEIKRRSV